ncbi:MAG: TIGR03905 family TSCPD domain-containing protein [Spirochaetales bacterium]|nr:TIGR03905 family TSCPD domain-containing protein [Spirochaetales bacterium]
MIEYKTRGTCSRRIFFNLKEGRVYDVRFEAGCNGNLKAIGTLVEGMEAAKLISLFKNHTCGKRKTSCTAQLALALEQALHSPPAGE